MSEQDKSQDAPNEISEQELETVAGGSLQEMMQILSNIMKSNDEVKKTIVRNMRG